MAKPQVPKTAVDVNDNSWVRWFSTISDQSIQIIRFTPTLAPALVAANSSAEQTLPVAGLRLDDVVVALSYVTHDVGVVVYNPRVTAVDTLALSFANTTGGGITPTSQIYTIHIIRL